MIVNSGLSGGLYVYIYILVGGAVCAHLEK
jgi:hypothetical protein